MRSRGRRLGSVESLEARQLLAVSVFQRPFGDNVTSGGSSYAVLMVDSGDNAFLTRNVGRSYSFANNAQFLNGPAPNQAVGFTELPSNIGNLTSIYVTSGSTQVHTGGPLTPTFGNTFVAAADPGPAGIIPGTFFATVTATDDAGNTGTARLLAKPDFSGDLRVERFGGGTGPIPTTDSRVGLFTGTVSLVFDPGVTLTSVRLTPVTWGTYDPGPAPVSLTITPGQTPNQRFYVDFSRNVGATSVTIDSPMNATLGEEGGTLFGSEVGYVLIAATNVVTNANISVNSDFIVTAFNAQVNRPIEAGNDHAFFLTGNAESRGSLLVSEQGALVGKSSAENPFPQAADQFLFKAVQADLFIAGVVNAAAQTYFFQSPPDDPRGSTFTTVSPSTGLQSGEIIGGVVGVTLGSSAGGDVNLRTAVRDLRLTAASTPEFPVLPYAVNIEQVRGDLNIDAVPASSRPISINAVNGTITLSAAVRTTGDVSIKAKNQLTIPSPVSSAAGNVVVQADSLSATSLVTAGRMGNVSLESTANTGDLTLSGSVRAGGRVKSPVRAATTAPIALTGLQTIDGVALAAGDRVLVKNQAVATQNGIYVVAAGNWARATDANISSLFDPGFMVSVLQGGSQRGNWAFANPTNPTLGQSAIFFVPVTASQIFLPARVATTASITLSGTPTIDGVALVAGDRVLVKNQLNERQNGVYVVSAGPWERASDANTSPDLRAGTYVFVREGGTNGQQGFMLDNDAVQVGNTPLTFSPFLVQATRTNPFTPANILEPVVAATATRIVLSGLQTIDGIDVAPGDRVLVKNQTDPAQNGVYVAAAGAWTRAADAATSAGLARGTTVWVTGGTENGSSSWFVDDTLAGLGGITLGGTNVTGLASTASLLTGMLVAGPGIPTGTTIEQIVSPTSIRLSFPTTVTDPTVALTFTRTTPVGVGTEPVFFLRSGGLVSATAGRAVTGSVDAVSRLQGAIGLVNAGRPTSGSADPEAAILAATDVGRLFAAAPAGITVSNSGAIDLADVRTLVGGGIKVEAGGTLTAISVSAQATPFAKGDVSLVSNSGDLVAATVNTAAGAIALAAASGDVIVTKVGRADANVISKNGSVTVLANRAPGAPGGNIRIDGRLAAEGTGSDIVLSTNDGLLTFTKAATVTAADQLRIFTPARTPSVAPEVAGKIGAGRLSIEAPFGAGQTSYPAGLGTYQVVNVNRTDDGDLDVTSPAALTIEGASTKNGSVAFTAPAVTVAGPIRPGGATSAIALTATGGNLAIDAPLDSPTTISLSAPAGRVSDSAGGPTPLLAASDTLVVRAATAANLLTQIKALDVALSGENAQLTVVEADDLVIQSATLAAGGLIDVRAGSPAVGGSATVVRADAGAGGTVKIMAQESILSTVDGTADILGSRAELLATTGRIDVETAVQAIKASAPQGSQSIAISDVGTGKAPLLLESVTGGSSVSVAIKAARTIDAERVKTTGTVSLQSLGPNSDILVGSVEATGNSVSLAAANGIRERSPGDPDADVTAATVSLVAGTGSIDLQLAAAEVSAVAVGPKATIRLRDADDLSIGDGVTGIQGNAVTIEVGGTLAQTRPITATGLLDVRSTGGDIVLRNPGNSVGELFARNPGRTVAYRDSGMLRIATGAGGIGLEATNVDLTGGTGISQAGAIKASALLAGVTAAGAVVLTSPSNVVGGVSGSTFDGDFRFHNSKGFFALGGGVKAGTEAPVAGNGNILLSALTGDLGVLGDLTAIGDTITLQAPNGTIIQQAGIIQTYIPPAPPAGTLRWTAARQPVLTNVVVGNQIVEIGGNISIGVAGQDITVPETVTAAGNITIVGRNITIAGPVTTQSGRITVTSTGAVTFAPAAVLTGSDVLFSAANSSQLVLGANVPVAGATVAAGTLDLSSRGALRQTGPITAPTLAAAAGPGGGITLSNAANQVGVFSARAPHAGGNVVFQNAGGFSVGGTGITAGTAAAGDGLVSLVALAGDLTVAAPISAVADLVELRAPGGLVVVNSGVAITSQNLIVIDSAGGSIRDPFQVDSAESLANTLAIINSLPAIAGTNYEIVVTSDVTLTQPLTVSRPVTLVGSGPGTRINGSASAPNGITFDTAASGSQVRNLVFNGFSGTALQLLSARNVAVADTFIVNSGTGLFMQGTSTGTTVRGTSFIGTTTAMNLDTVEGAAFGGTQPPNVISGGTTGVFATGLSTGTTISGLVFDTSPSTVTPFNIGGSRNLVVTGTVFQNVDPVVPPSPGPASGRPAVDLDGNGVADVLWVSTGGEVIAWLDGNPNTSRTLGGGGGWTLGATGDFNADGVSDLVWRNPDGIYVVWLMNSGGATIDQRYLGGGGGWELEATGDYDGDGRTDLVWRNSVNGANVMWLMNGVTPTSQTVVGGNLDWRLVSTDERFDANADGKTDLIWRHAASGVNVLWRMNGSSVISTRSLGGDASWRIAGTGDFDGDGKGDVLWRNAASGSVIMQLLDDGAVKSQGAIGGDAASTVAVTMDADGDGKADIYWRNLGSGATERWLMNGTTVRSKTPIGGNTVWRLLGRPGTNG